MFSAEMRNHFIANGEIEANGKKGEKREESNKFLDFPQDQIQQTRYYIKVKLFTY